MDADNPCDRLLDESASESPFYLSWPLNQPLGYPVAEFHAKLQAKYAEREAARRRPEELRREKEKQNNRRFLRKAIKIFFVLLLLIVICGLGFIAAVLSYHDAFPQAIEQTRRAMAKNENHQYLLYMLLALQWISQALAPVLSFIYEHALAAWAWLQDVVKMIKSAAR